MPRSDFAPLDSCEVLVGGAQSAAARVAARHLALLGARCARDTEMHPAAPYDCGEDVVELRPDARSGAARSEPIPCRIRWPGWPAAEGTGAEALVQAVSGLMAVHGHDHGVPRRLGLDVASVATGVLTSQALLAAMLGQRRGHDDVVLEVPAVSGGLMFLLHHLTSATCGDDWHPPVAGDAPGPPFRTRDGHWVEIELLDAGDWRAFWHRLGVTTSALDMAWLSFAFRANTASCRLPVELHQATRRATLAELARHATACGGALCRVRGYTDLLADAAAREARAAGGGPLIPWLLRDADGTESNRPPASGVRLPTADAPTFAPLAGVRMVEVTSRVQGPLAGQLLRWLGADVQRVEPPGGDPAREAPPMAGITGAAFLAYNAGKTAIEIDYKSPAGRRAVAELVAGADVFVQNWPAGRAESVGLDAPSLHRLNPRLVWAHASGWGSPPPPDAPAIATDYLVQAHAACGAGLAPAGRPPLPSRVTLADVMGGLVCVEAVLAALLRRESTGRGACVETSLLSGCAVLQAPALERISTAPTPRRSAGRPVWGPFDEPLLCADGYLMVSPRDPVEERRALMASGLTAVPAGAAPVRRRFAGHAVADCERAFRDAGVPVARLLTELGDAPASPYLVAALEEVPGHCWTVAPPWRRVR